MITTPLRILLVEDLSADIELIRRHIKKIVVDPVIKVVENLDDCNTALTTFIPDVVLADYNLPTCSGLDVLELTKSVDDSIPFIFLTGAIENEEMAANTILAGASGFILKKEMKILNEKLKPLLKQVVFNMDVREEIREKVRKNKIAVNQIYQYLDKIKADNAEQQENLNQIRRNIDKIHLEDEGDDK